MKMIPQGGDRYFKWKGKLVRHISTINDKAHRFEYVDPNDMEKCECGRPIREQITVIESSPSFQENAEPVDTLYKPEM